VADPEGDGDESPTGRVEFSRTSLCLSVYQLIVKGRRGENGRGKSRGKGKGRGKGKASFPTMKS